MRFLLLLLVPLFFSGSLLSQGRVALPDSLTKEQEAMALKEAKKCFAPQSDFDFSFKSTDLNPNRPAPKPVMAATEDEARRLKNKLKGNIEDAQTCYDIALIYKRKFNYRQAGKWFVMADSMNLERIGANTSDAALWSFQGKIRMEMGLLEKAIYAMATALEKDPNDKMARELLPVILIFISDFKSAETVIRENLKTTKDSLQEYVQLSSLHFLKFFTSEHAVAFGTDKKYYLEHSIDELYDFSEFEKLMKDKPGDYRYQLLYHLNRELALLSKSYFTFDIDDRKFDMSAKDIEHLDELEKFYLAGLKRKDDDFIYHNALGAVYMMKNDFKKAISSFKKALKAKPMSKCTPADHQGNIYDNIMGAQLLSRDTVAAYETMKAKIAARATIDEQPKDYTMLARFNANENDMVAMKANCMKALAIDTTHLDAYLGLAYIAIAERDFRSAGHYLDVVLSNNKNEVNATVLLGIGALLQKDIATADFIFKRVLDVNPKDQLVLRLRKIYLP